MTSHSAPTPAPKTRQSVHPLPSGAPLSSWLGRWLFDHPHPPSHAGLCRDDVQRLIQARTIELEREIADLRAEIDRAKAAAGNSAPKVSNVASAADTRFVASIAHELRTPLNGLIGIVQLLTQTNLTSEQTDMVKTISRSSECLLWMVNDILDYAAGEAENLRLKIVDFDLAEELQVAIDLQAGPAARKGLELIVDIDPALPLHVRGDPVRLRQVVLNLLHNAIKFTERGEVAFCVRLERGTPGRVRVQFIVSDTGIGISPAVQTQLFQPFFQGAPETAQRYGGTGLGLAISKQLVQQMGGDIGVTSAPQTGSTFWFNVELEHASVASKSTPAASSLANRHILIVDDNATNRKLFCQLAVTWSMRAGMADSATAAIAYLHEANRSDTPVDLVLVDHQLHGCDGLALADAIAAEELKPRPALVMLATGGRRPTRAEMDHHAIAGCGVKPLHPRKLRQLLERALAGRRT